MTRTGWAPLMLSVAAVAVACSSFDSEDDSPSGDAGVDSSLANDGGTTTDPPPGACTGTAIESDAAPDRNCNGDGLLVELESSKVHCGRCGRSCGPDDCVGGLCAPYKLAGGTVGALAATETDVFWATTGTSATLMRQPLAGGTATTLAQTSGGNEGISAVMVDEARVYVNAQFEIYWLPVDADGGVAKAPISPNNNTRNFLAQDSTHLYWGRGNVVDGWPKDGSSPPTAVSSPLAENAGVSCVVADDSTLYWGVAGADTDAGPANHKIYQRAKAGDVAIRAQGIAAPFALALDAEHVYWGDREGRVSRVRRADASAPETFASAAAYPWVRSVAVDASHVYWTATTPNTDAGTSYDGVVLRAPRCGGGLVETVARSNVMTGSLWLDEAHVLFGSLEGMKRVRK